MQDAGGVHEPLDGVVGGGFEGLGDLLVHHQVHGVGLAEPAHRGEGFYRAGQVVDHLEGHDQVVGARGRPRGEVTGDVDDLEVGSVAHTGVGGVLAGGHDGRFVVVEAVDPELGERPGE